MENPNNTNNPYDEIGEIHNQKLDQWTSDIDHIDEESSTENNVFLSNTMAELESINSTDESVINFINEIKNNLNTIATTETPFGTNLKNSTESNIAHDYIDQLINIMSSNSSISIDDHLTTIIDLENLIIANNSTNQILLENEKVILLMATSVARHSSAYWHNVQNNPTPWGGLSGTGGNAELNWKNIAQADLKGFAYAAMRAMLSGVIMILASGGVSAAFTLAGIGLSAAWASADEAASQRGWW